MKNYKVVSVYSGRGEMSINGSYVVEGECVRGVCEDVLEDKKKMMEEDESYFEEFVNVWGVKDGVGYVGDNEEGFDVVFEEGSKWFELVEEMGSWSDEVNVEWDKLCKVDYREYEVKGKI